MLDLDEDGYPTEEALLKIEKWPDLDFVGLMEYIHSLWKYSEWGWEYTDVGPEHGGPAYYLHTGGWSGNESLIGAMQKHLMLWVVCWQESRRGGHYKFELPRGGA